MGTNINLLKHKTMCQCHVVIAIMPITNYVIYGSILLNAVYIVYIYIYIYILCINVSVTVFFNSK